MRFVPIYRVLETALFCERKAVVVQYWRDIGATSGPRFRVGAKTTSGNKLEMQLCHPFSMIITFPMRKHLSRCAQRAGVAPMRAKNRLAKRAAAL